MKLILSLILLLSFISVADAKPPIRYSTDPRFYSPMRDRMYPMRGVIGDPYYQLYMQGYIIPANCPKRNMYYGW